MMEAKFFDSLYEGDSPNGVKLGMGVTGGDFWGRLGGCSVLYRGCSMETIDFTNILAVAEADAGTIQPPGYVAHNSGSTHFYVIRRVNNCGYLERTLAAAVKVSIDADGDLAPPRPNDVFIARAEKLAGGKIQLLWYYCPVEQKSEPLCFKVYYDSGTGQVDYENPITTIGYEGRKFYSYQSDVLGAGRYSFAIKVENAVGIEDSSLAQLTVQLDTMGTGAINIVSVEAV